MRMLRRAADTFIRLSQARAPRIAASLIAAAAFLFLSGGVAQAQNPPQNPQMVPVLQGLLQNYRKCILEEYENQVSENDKNKTNPHALGPKRDAAICVAGNTCTRASRQDTYNRLKAQADRGDPTNFETSLEQAILNDCMSCAKHNELHTKLMHCTLECNGNQNWSENPFKFDAGVGPCFEGCKAGVDIEKLVNDVVRTIRGALQGLQGVGQALSSPTVESTDARGYRYVETSERWDQMCTAFPCFAALQWPDYASYSFNDTIDGHPVVIQLWKGYCEKFLGMEKFPGGIGAEVGIYRRIPGKRRPTSLPFLPPSVAAPLLKPPASLTDQDWWWAYPELKTKITFTLTNPVTKEVFFSTGKEKETYWLNKWMNEGSYLKYKQDQGAGKTPRLAHEVEYQLTFTINGKTYKPW